MQANIRPAQIEDCAIILELIKELADYEKLSQQMVATLDEIKNSLFSPDPKAEVIILEQAQEVAGFALYFHNYSTFLGKYGLYIEDLYVREKFRAKGYGKALLQHICKTALARGCGRVEWWCLDWNKNAIDFYLNLQAEAMSDWTVYRLDKQTMQKIVDS